MAARRPVQLSLGSRKASACVVVLLAVVAWFGVRRSVVAHTTPKQIHAHPEVLHRFRAAVEKTAATAEPRRYLVFRATKFSGGLGDRLLGLVSTIALAIVTKRQLLIEWAHPAELSTVLVCIVDDCSGSVIRTSGALRQETVSLIDKRLKLQAAFEHEDLTERWAGVDVVTISQNQNTCAKTAHASCAACLFVSLVDSAAAVLSGTCGSTRTRTTLLHCNA